MIKFITFLALVFLLVYNLPGQNLIPNPGFERHDQLFKLRNLGGLNDWQSSGIGGADFYEERFANTFAFSGDCWTGIGVLVNSLNKYHYEYMSVKLISPLLKDSIYCIKLFVKRHDFYNYVSENVQFALTEKKIIYLTRNDVIKTPVHGNLSNNDTLFENEKWVEISSFYKAEGGEEFFTLGWFDHPTKLIPAFSSMSQRDIIYNGIYYFIDDISLFQIGDTNDCLCKEKINGLEELKMVGANDSAIKVISQKRYILNNLNFATNSYALSMDAQLEIDNLYDFLIVNENLNARISGYTDNIGDKNKNQILSLQRAESVRDYLVSKGVSDERISCFGYGMEKPLETNKTKEGRATNRRVEVEFFIGD